MKTLFRHSLIAGVALSALSLAPHAAQAQTVVISQVYGGGGSTATAPAPSYKYDFVELYNNGPTQINLAGYSLQYFSAAGTSAAINVLQGTIDPGGYYLVREGTPNGTITGADLTTYNDIGGLNLAAAAGKIGLASSSTVITFTSAPASVITGAVDFVGYGTAATAYEGTGAAPATSTTTSITRKFLAGAYVDTNNNNADFNAAATPIPHAGAYVYVAPAPEPSSIVALAIGAGVLGLMVARRRTGQLQAA